MLTADIKAVLTPDSKRVLLITVGNSLRGDDGVGIYLAQKLKELPKKIKLLNAWDKPENIMSEVIGVKPGKIIFIDAADFQGIPGEIRLIPMESIPESTLSTHTFPLRVVAHILEKDTGAKVYFLGIQPLSMDFGSELSGAVLKTAEELVEFIQGDLADA